MTDFEVFAIPAVKNSDTIHAGRPSCGLALFYSKHLTKYCTHLEVPNSHRVHALKVKLTSGIFVFINTYFPTDPRVQNFDELQLHNTLEDINYIFDSCGPNAHYTLMGDINADFGRNTRFVQVVANFINEKNLVHIWNKFDCDFTHCQSQVRNNRPNMYFSTIDHFFVSENLNDCCVSAMPIHLAENTSNHDPIYIELNIDVCAKPESEVIPERVSKPAWNKAKPENMEAYISELEHLLSQVEIPVDTTQCNNVHCDNPIHKVDCDIYAMEIMECISKSVENNIPYTSTSDRKAVPCWTEHVKPYKEDAKFWYAVWLSAGRPQNNNLHRIMKNTRNKYNYALRRIKRSESALRKDKFVQDCLSGNVNNVLKEIKKMRNQNRTSDIIDGKSGNANIATHFKEKYSGIYNTHKDKDQVNIIRNNICGNISPTDISEINKINPDLLIKVINKMKLGKNDVSFDWRSNALKIGRNVLAPHLSALLRSFYVHGHVTDVLLKCALVPIVKDQNSSQSSSENYRAIAISSLIMKLIDYVIIELQPDAFTTSSYQFGFQSNSSTTLCSWALTETINNFTSSGSAVYVCFLDLKKAFDLIQLSKLFEKLDGRLHPIHLRLLIHCYIKQTCCVRWNGVDSNTFKTTNGVRQGSSTSPSLFSIYIDSLFFELEKSGLGCYIENQFLGAFGYADDIVLLSPSLEALQKMVDICKLFCDNHGLKISLDRDPKKSKTKCVQFNSVNTSPTNIVLNNIPVPWSDSYKHLGHIISADEDMFHDQKAKCGEFNSKVHSLRQEIGEQYPSVFIKLVNIYLSSFYGSSLWDLSADTANKLWTVWNTLIRDTYNLPYGTHRYIIADILGPDHLKIKILRRFINFYKLVSKSSKPTVRVLFLRQRGDLRSTFGRNCQHIKDICNVQNVNNANLHNFQAYPVPPQDAWRLPLIEELIYIRDHLINVDNLTSRELGLVMEQVACK